jgi:hypothetical protein
MKKNLSFAIAMFFVVLSVFAPASAALGQTQAPRPQTQTVTLEVVNFPDELKARKDISAYYKKAGIIFVDRNSRSVERTLRVTADKRIVDTRRVVDYNQRGINQRAEVKIRLIQAAYDEAVRAGDRATRGRFYNFVEGGAYAYFHNLAEKERAKIQPDEYDLIEVTATVKVEWVDKRGEVTDQSIGTVSGVFERHELRPDGTYVLVADDSLGPYGVQKGTLVQDRQLQWLLDLAFIAAQDPSAQTIGR